MADEKQAEKQEKVKSVSVKISEYAKKTIDAYAKKYEISFEDASERVAAVAVSRLNALAKYAKRVKAGEVHSKKPSPKKKAAKKAA